MRPYGGPVRSCDSVYSPAPLACRARVIQHCRCSSEGQIAMRSGHHRDASDRLYIRRYPAGHMHQISGRSGNAINHMPGIVSPMTETSVSCIRGYARFGIADLAHQIGPRRRNRAIAAFHDNRAPDIERTEQHGNGGGWQNVLCWRGHEGGGIGSQERSHVRLTFMMRFGTCRVVARMSCTHSGLSEGLRSEMPPVCHKLIGSPVAA